LDHKNLLSGFLWGEWTHWGISLPRNAWIAVDGIGRSNLSEVFSLVCPNTLSIPLTT